MKVMTVVGTRPEIIRLSRVIAKFDEVFDHTLVHTGQNWDLNLKDIFFEEMNIRRPDINFQIDVSSLGSSIAGVISGTEKAINEIRPDAFLVLGDTNSALSLIMARRMRVPSYHMEAGNRSFDERVPEETNRRLLDHTADFNLVYTEHARRNLLAEGIHPSRISLTGTPLREVFNAYSQQINGSSILEDLGLCRGEYFLVSAHREETVDNPGRFDSLLDALNAVAARWHLPIVVSTHPRTATRLAQRGLAQASSLLQFHTPFGFFDYNQLQRNATCVLSDSGSVGEESAILNFRAVTLRKRIERPEVLESSHVVQSDVDPERVLASLDLVLSSRGQRKVPDEYQIADTSHRVAAYIESTRSL